MRKVLVSVVALAVLCVAGNAGAESRGYKLVVNKANAATALDKGEVAKLFMKQSVKWASGQTVEPVDQAPSAGVRERFSNDVHGKAVAAVQSAWQRIIFSGRGVPPPEVGSDEAVLSFVAEHPGGIGYVGEGAGTDRVKVVDVK
jgi:ABC-type phosphate transport system substrate-binding protein